jgi:hypothetical protein
MKLQQVHASRNPRTSLTKLLWFGLLAALCAIAFTPAVCRGLLQNTYPHLPPELNRIPDGNQANDINAQQAQNRSFEAANAQRKKQITDDSTRLLKLATDLKAEVDATNKDTLSLNVIRKADEIEKLARSVKEKMKLTVGST